MHTSSALAAALILGVGLTACDSFGTPERFLNEDARPPTVEALDVADLQPGQHVAGDVWLALDLDSLAGRVSVVRVWLDDAVETPLASLTSAHTFWLHTASYASGDHVLHAAVYTREPNHGLLNALGAPSALLSIPLVFDQRAPTSVQGATVEVEGTRPRLRWEPSADANFYAYVVYRRPSLSTSGGPGEIVATLTDRAQTTFLDAPLAEVYGRSATYRVAISNRVEEALPEAGVTATYGTRFSDLRAHDGSVARSPDGSVLYVAAGNRLSAVSAATGQRLRSVPITDLDAYTPSSASLHVDPASGRIVALFRHEVVVYEPVTLDVVARYEPPHGMTRVVLRDGRLYGVATHVATRRLFVLDAFTGAELARSTSSFEGPIAEVAALSPTGDAAYVMDRRNHGAQPALVRVDLTGAAPILGAARTVGITYSWAVAVAADGRVFATAGDAVLVLDGADLRLLGTLDLEGPAVRSAGQALLVEGGRLYVGYWREGETALGLSVVAEVDASTLAVRRTWALDGFLTGLAPSPRGLYVFDRDGAWSLSL